jgi:ribosomal-protein-alanine N-acetyltransferase
MPGYRIGCRAQATGKASARQAASADELADDHDEIGPFSRLYRQWGREDPTTCPEGVGGRFGTGDDRTGGEARVTPLRLPDPPLSDGRILLRPWRIADLALVELASRDPEITVGTSVPAPYSEAAGDAWLARQHTQREQRTGISLAIADAGSGQALGYIGVSGLVWRHLRGSLGYWVAGARRRQGVASAAVALLVPWVFSALGLVRVEAVVDVDNHASQRVLERNGFRTEGVLRGYYEMGGDWRDMMMFARLADPSAPGWRTRHAQG